jgi:hypothetical protein
MNVIYPQGGISRDAEEEEEKEEEDRKEEEVKEEDKEEEEKEINSWKTPPNLLNFYIFVF